METEIQSKKKSVYDTEIKISVQTFLYINKAL